MQMIKNENLFKKRLIFCICNVDIHFYMNSNKVKILQSPKIGFKINFGVSRVSEYPCVRLSKTYMNFIYL